LALLQELLGLDNFLNLALVKSYRFMCFKCLNISDIVKNALLERKILNIITLNFCFLYSFITVSHFNSTTKMGTIIYFTVQKVIFYINITGVYLGLIGKQFGKNSLNIFWGTVYSVCGEISGGNLTRIKRKSKSPQFCKYYLLTHTGMALYVVKGLSSGYP
jgi:hypothetical protein